MAAGIGQALGLNYELPLNINQGIQNRRGGGAPQTGGPNIGSPAEGLQYVEGVTRDYYSKWGELQSFATNMWENFGVDVTKPDFRKPEAMEAHELYNKALADLRYQGDQLKSGQTMLEKLAQAKMSAHGADIGREGEGLMTYDQIQNTGMTDRETVAAREQQMLKQQELIESREDLRQTRLDERQRKGFIHTEDMTRLRADLMKQGINNKYADLITTRADNIAGVLNGNESLLTTLVTSDGSQLFTTATKNHVTGVIYATNEKGETIKLDPRDKNVGIKINEILDKSGDRVKWEDIKAHSNLFKGDSGEIKYPTEMGVFTDGVNGHKMIANDGIQSAVKAGKVVIPPGMKDEDGYPIEGNTIVTQADWKRSGKDRVILTYKSIEGDDKTVTFETATKEGMKQYKEFLSMNADAFGWSGGDAAADFKKLSPTEVQALEGQDKIDYYKQLQIYLENNK